MAPVPETPPHPPPSRAGGPVAILVGPLGVGGIGAIVVQQARSLLENGFAVDVLVLDRASPFLGQLPRGANVVRLASLHPVLGVAALAWYLRRRRPRALLSHRPRFVRQLRLAARLAGHRPRLVAVIHNHLSAQLARQADSVRLRRAVESLADCDRLVAVSRGVAADAEQLIGPLPHPIEVAYPALAVDRIRALATQPARAPRLATRPADYLVAVGRLEAEKDFPTLLEAFSRLDPADAPLDLVVLGEGRERATLEAQAERLGCSTRVHLAGFADNPYPWIAGARLLVLSSLHEAFGIVLAEALALGVPVVATDCPSGPREILDGGRYGRLVPPRDPAALAAAIAATLHEPPDRADLEAAVGRFTPEASMAAYLAALGLA